MKKILFLIAVIAVAAGCVQQPEPLKDIIIPGHGDDVYTFANDIHEALRVPTNDAAGIHQIGNDFVRMSVVFNGANTTDNAYFRVVIFNLLVKTQLYYSYDGKYTYFDSYYYIGDTWYNATGGEIAKPEFSNPVLWLIGPSEANDTSVNLVDNIIYLSGTSYTNMTLAGDRLALIFFGIDQV